MLLKQFFLFSALFVLCYSLGSTEKPKSEKLSKLLLANGVVKRNVDNIIAFYRFYDESTRTNPQHSRILNNKIAKKYNAKYRTIDDLERSMSKDQLEKYVAVVNPLADLNIE